MAGHRQRAREDRQEQNLCHRLEPPISGRHTRRLYPFHPLQMGLKRRDIPDSAGRLEHGAKPVHTPEARAENQRQTNVFSLRKTPQTR